MDVAFAVWNGSNGDRNGQKAVSEFSVMTLTDVRRGLDIPLLLIAIVLLTVTLVLVLRGISRLEPSGHPEPTTRPSPDHPGPTP